MTRFRIDPDTLDFALSENLIAQTPAKQRDHARLMVLHRNTGAIEHRIFSDIIDYLNAGDVLVINKAKVSRAKLAGQKSSGGKVEVIFLERINNNAHWKALVRPFVKTDAEIKLGDKLTVAVKSRFESGEYLLETKSGDVEQALTHDGKLPLPPYIKRAANDPLTALDENEYQTVYASTEGSVAAPTAGLHFSEALLEKIKKKGVRVVDVLLHVGWGTFKPITESVRSHKMLGEKYEVSAETLNELTSAKREGRRIVAVGTTSTRTLESLEKGATGETSLFIQPGFQFKWVNALITNLHVPRSTPVSLTAAFAGLHNLEKAYEVAIAENYRFFSYGDAMMVLE